MSIKWAREKSTTTLFSTWWSRSRLVDRFERESEKEREKEGLGSYYKWRRLHSLTLSRKTTSWCLRWDWFNLNFNITWGLKNPNDNIILRLFFIVIYKDCVFRIANHQFESFFFFFWLNWNISNSFFFIFRFAKKKRKANTTIIHDNKNDESS